MRTFRILSYNIQTGIKTSRFSQYFTRGWQHVLPSSSRQENLKSIGRMMADFDFCGIQEVDGGSFRSRFRSQSELLAEYAGLPYFHAQRTRNLGAFAQHGNAILSRTPLHRLTLSPLPGRIPGRGVMFAELDAETVLVNTHLALNQGEQYKQLKHIIERIAHYRYRIVLGDFNATSITIKSWLEQLAPDMALVSQAPTYPSWQPRVALDHIILSRSIAVHDYTVMQHHYSDHLPVCATIQLPSRSE